HLDVAAIVRDSGGPVKLRLGAAILDYRQHARLGSADVRDRERETRRASLERPKELFDLAFRDAQVLPRAAVRQILGSERAALFAWHHEKKPAITAAKAHSISSLDAPVEENVEGLAPERRGSGLAFCLHQLIGEPRSAAVDDRLRLYRALVS